ncbi:follistatin-like [Ornithodoros turicata]|uniref:follistatin-like n=1 Tax=Ornithodoros turicata TaxID=34597 RepID=UPI003138E6FA
MDACSRSQTAQLALLAAVVCLSSAPLLVHGGLCWSMVGSSRRCTELLKSYVSREECCADGGASTAWSPEDLSSGDLFKWRALGGGVPCKLCKESCVGVSCGAHERCVVKRQQPHCVCAPRCGPKGGRRRDDGPVCGTDQRTYKNACRLMKKRCRRRDPQLAIAYHMPCQSSCDRVVCPGKKSCLLDQNLVPHCVRCRVPCPAAEPRRYVCSVDNVTYTSYCQLRQAACAKGRAVPAAYRGRCRDWASCSTVRCQRGKQCVTERETGHPRCVTCPSSCRSWPQMEPLCGGDGNTYASWCHLMQAACRTGTFVPPAHSGPCAINNGSSAEFQPQEHLNIIPVANYDTGKLLAVHAATLTSSGTSTATTTTS